jgi:MFS family permease
MPRMTDNDKNRQWAFITFAAAAVMMVTMGARQSQGLFVFPLSTSTGLGIVTISFALAVGQFVWGAVQPVAGAMADRYGSGRVLAAGVLLLAMGSALTPLMTTGFGLVLTLGLLSAIGAGAGSFSVLIGAVSSRVPVSHRGTVSGVINAGGSFGQFVFAPLLQALISVVGWMGAMWSLAALTIAALPLLSVLRAPRASVSVAESRSAGDGGLRAAVKNALADSSYLLLHAGFFTCGFHIAFLVTHLPGEVICAVCRHRSPAGRWRSSVSQTSPAVSRQDGS